MVDAPTLLGPDLEASHQVGKVFACEQIVLAGIRAPDGLCPDLAARPQAARMFETLLKVNHLEDVRTPNGLGPDLAAKRVVELFETRFGAIWIPVALGPAKRVFEMLERNFGLEQGWTPGALSPDLAASHQAERLFGMLTRTSHLELC